MTSNNSNSSTSAKQLNRCIAHGTNRLVTQKKCQFADILYTITKIKNKQRIIQHHDTTQKKNHSLSDYYDLAYRV